MAEASILNGLFNCAICLEKIRTPRMLPCSHCFCEICISEYIVRTVAKEQYTFNCPVCRSTVEAGDPTVDKTKWTLFLPTISDNPNVSDGSKHQNCHPCKSLNKETEACLWCCDCNEALCQSCSEVHSRLKITSTHKTVAIEKTDNFEKSVVDILQATSENCSIHQDERIEIYCKDHSEAVCIRCLSDRHRNCENWQVIDCTDETKEESIANLQSEINLLQSSLKQLTEGQNQQKTNLESKFSSIEAEGLKIINQLKIKFDDLYIEFLKNVGLKQDELQGDLDCNFQRIQELSSILKSMMRDVQFVSLYGSKVQIFTVARKYKLKLDEVKQDILSLVRENPSVGVRYSFDNVLKIMETINDLCCISITKNKLESHLAEDNTIFNLFSTIQFSTISLKLSFILDFPDNSVLSSVYLDNETCAVLFWDSLSIVLIKSNRTISTMKVHEMPKKLCFDHIKRKLFCSSNGCSGFHCKVRGQSLERYRYSKFLHKVCGVDLYNGKVLTITEGAILKSEDFEHHETWLKTSVCGVNDDIAFDGCSERFSVLNFEKHKISFGNVSQKVLKPFDDGGKISSPRSIAFGPYGLLFVTEKSQFVHVIYSDEKSCRTLLSKLQKIDHVSDITVSYDYKKLFVSGDRYVEIYDILN